MTSIDILLPIYNRVHLIRECLDSIYKSPFEDYHIILVDDGSTDDLDSVLTGYDDRLQVYHLEHVGIVGALNYGLDHCTAKYIVRMDSDDLMCPERLEKQYAWMESHPDISLMGCMFEFPDGYRLKRLEKYDYPVDIEHIEPPTLIHPTMIYRREDLERVHLRYEPEFEYIEDCTFFVHALELGLKLYHSSEIFAIRYLVREDSVSSTKHDLQMNLYMKLKERIKKLKANEKSNTISQGV